MFEKRFGVEHVLAKKVRNEVDTGDQDEGRECDAVENAENEETAEGGGSKYRRAMLLRSTLQPISF